MKALIQAAKGLKPARTPLWLMRQAGRYLPEYREVRTKHDTLTMFQTPSIAAEITMQPLRRFDLDAAIIYADILLIPAALNLGLTFVTGEGPKFSRTIRSAEDLNWLQKQAENKAQIISKLNYVAETVDRTKAMLPAHASLIGFAGAPWTVASYMIEGGSAGGEFFESKLLMFKSPEVLHGLLSIITDITIDYLNMQVDAGAEILQLFESWGGALTPQQYSEFCAPYSARILKALQPRVPVIHFVGEGAGILEEVLTVPTNVLGVDWRQDLSRVSKRTESLNIALQGNLDPLLLYAPQAEMEKQAQKILEAGRAHKGGFIFNLGHGIRLTTPVERVGQLVDLVHCL